MRDKFMEEMELLHSQLTEMGWLCEEVITKACDALIRCDKSLIDGVLVTDEKINQKEKDIERLCLKLLLMQQPVAGDLRQVSAALKMITDMERIGDQAADIAEIIAVADLAETEALLHIEEMAKTTISMVVESINAFVQSDLKIARRVIECDNIVDSQFLEIRKELIEYIGQNAIDNGGMRNAEYAVDLLMIAKYFERIGDHATNIAEWVLFSITGERINSEMEGK